MAFDRLHYGRPGVWLIALICSVGSIIVGGLFVWDGKGVVGSPAYDPAKHLIHALGAPTSSAMQWWGLVFVVVGGLAVWPLLVPRNLLIRGRFLVPVACLWLLFSVMFLSYAIDHNGTGAVGAVIWAMVAACALSASFVLFSHARRG